MNPTNPTSAANLRRNRLTMALIVSVFVAPIGIAWLYANGILNWHPRGLVNHGTLISPPIDFARQTTLPPTHPLMSLAPSNWAMVVINDGACDDACGVQLDRLSVIRELLGQGSERVAVFALARTNAESKHHSRIIVDSNSVDRLQQALAARSAKLPAIIFLDWRHQLMMRFGWDAPSKDIQQDLKRMLLASAIR